MTKVEDEEGETQKHGEPVKYDPTFNGPIKNRSCTDVICCLLFIIFFVAFLGVGVWSFTKGDPRLLLYPTDSDGNICGYGDYENKPYLFFFDMLDCYKVGIAVLAQGCPTPQICLDRCPDKMFAWPDAVADPKLRKELYCKRGVDPETTARDVMTLVEDEDCAPYYLDSSPVVGRCIPSVIGQLIDAVTGLVTDGNSTLVDKFGNAVNGTELEKGAEYLSYFLNLKDYGMKIFQDVRASWWMILVGVGVGMLIAFIWIILMRWIAGIIVWLTIILFVAIFGFGTYYCFDKYFDMKDNPANQGDFTFTTNLDYYWNLANTWLAFGIIAAVFLGVILILVLFLRQRIMIAISLIKEASRAVGNMVFTLFWPLIPFVLQIIVLAYFGASAIFLASMGQGTYSASNKTSVNITNSTTGQIIAVREYITQVVDLVPCDPTANSTAGSICNFFKYGGDEYTMYLQFFQLFMWFWLMNFIVALGQIVLAGSFASYYWAWEKPSDIPAFPVTASLWRALRYHLGSIAFGALLVAIIQLIRVILEYVDSKLKASENKVAKFLMQCLKCCFWCLEKFIKFINKNAYILIAVYGKNFCTSAKNAFMLIMRNILRVAVVDKVTDFVLFIGKLMVVGAIVLLAFLFFSGDIKKYLTVDSITDYIDQYTPSLNYYLIPVIVIAIGTYMVSAGFFSVYSMAVDTLFLCFLEDLERHDGSPEKPYYMSKELMKILGKKNDKPEGKKND